MKRTIKIILLTAAAALILSAGALAAGGGLAAFTDVRAMDSNTFMDVDSLSWYFGGVCHAYDKGIMTGTGAKTFSPKDTLTWSQAATIASVIHSRYYGTTLDTTVPEGGDWYTPYMNYAASAGLLPSNCPSGAAADSAYINRSSIAYLLAHAVDASALPEISDLSIPDIGSVGAEFQPSVRLLYAAGVVTGMDDGKFHGERYTTRAEIATVVTTLLMPSQRVSHDSAENSDMADYEGSLENDCVMAKVGGCYYCAFKYYSRKSDGTAGSEVYTLYRTDGNDNCSEVYTCPYGACLSDVSSYQGLVYFSVTYPGSNRGAVMCYDPSSGSTSTVFDQYAVRSYCWYAGRLYVLAFTTYGTTGGNGGMNSDRYTFGAVDGGKLTQLSGPYSYYQVMHFQPYGFMGRIYFKLSSYAGPTNLYACDPASGSLAKLSDANINASCFVGHRMYYLVYKSDGSFDSTLRAMSLAMPDFSDTLGTLPAGGDQTNRTLYSRDGYVYCLVSDQGKLYRMDRAGTTLPVINALGEYNAVTFCADKIVLVPNSFITSNPNEMKVYNLSSYSARILYGDFIGCSCWYQGARFVPDPGEYVYTSSSSVSTVPGIDIQVTQAYKAGNDLIVRAKYTNNTGRLISKLKFQYVNVYIDGQLCAASINDFVSMSLVINDIETFTFVIGTPNQYTSCDLSSGAVSIEIRPTY